MTTPTAAPSREQAHKHLRMAIQSLAFHLALSQHGRGSSVFDAEREAALEYLRTLAPDDGPISQGETREGELLSAFAPRQREYIETLTSRADWKVTTVILTRDGEGDIPQTLVAPALSPPARKETP